ncbi:methyl-accepting chemotaxis protein [Inhella sp.]|uniref:methyl-accepting chemotaxis protein n=1 Tax=Inhella sp. TaxID=1921806 RepID=UPI0035B0C1C7
MQASRLSLAKRMWAPVVIVLVLMGIVSIGVTLRTLKLIEDSKQRQTAQVLKLGLTAHWPAQAQGYVDASGLVLRGDADSATRQRQTELLAALRQTESQLKPTMVHEAERRALGQAAEALQALLSQTPQDADGWSQHAAKTLPPLLKAMDGLYQVQLREEEALRAEIAAGRLKSVYGSVILLPFIGLLLAASTIYLTRTIINPVKSLVGLAEHMAEGDLTREVRIDRTDELGTLQRALSDMRDGLADMVLRSNEGADSVQTAAAEIASGNFDLSQRTEQTAARVQQTNSAVSELGVAVRHSAESAATANQLAQQAAQEAARGGEVVTQVVSTMQEINTSSKRIADIIGTIDGIAFQTNILALNAAVEAARAGEQGRGFAVVAGEVRSLASRSAEAAREIKALIGASVEKVETGTRLVAEAGGTIEQLVGSVNRVSDVIGEISASTAEQNQHLAGVASSMGELDQMSQSNAALVEEGAAAAESLKDQAVKLHQLVSRYRVDARSMAAHAQGAAAPAPRAAGAAPPKATASVTQVKAPARPIGSAPAATAPKPALPPKPAAQPAAPAARSATPATDDGDWETF